MAECGHYDHWREDLKLVLALGCRYVREGPGRYDWSFTDEVMPTVQDLGITRCRMNIWVTASWRSWNMARLVQANGFGAGHLETWASGSGDQRRPAP